MQTVLFTGSAQEDQYLNAAGPPFRSRYLMMTVRFAVCDGDPDNVKATGIE